MKGSIYFIQAQDGGPIKIGRAVLPTKRLAELQVGNPYPLVIRRTIECENCVHEERHLHGLFAQFRMIGEWFKPHPALASLADAVPDEGLAAEDLSYVEADKACRTPVAWFGSADPAVWGAITKREVAERVQSRQEQLDYQQSLTEADLAEQEIRWRRNHGDEVLTSTELPPEYQ